MTEDPTQFSKVSRALGPLAKANTASEDRQSGSTSPNKQRRETTLNNIQQRRLSAAPQSFNHNKKNQHIDTGDEEGDEISEDASIFNKFKKKFGVMDKRPGFLQVFKMDAGVTEDNRLHSVNTT